MWVTKANFCRNALFCLRYFRFFSNWFHRSAFSTRLTVARSVTSIIWKNDWLKSGIALIRTFSTEQRISGVIDCLNVSARKEDTFNIWCKQLDCFEWHWLHLKTLGVRQRYLKFICPQRQGIFLWTKMSFHVRQTLFKSLQVSACYCKMFRGLTFLWHTVQFQM